MTTSTAWPRTGCCDMPVNPDRPLPVELVRHRDMLAVVHRKAAWCVVPAQWSAYDDGLPVCFTCSDTGLVRRRSGASVLCPMHCDAAWARLHIDGGGL